MCSSDLGGSKDAIVVSHTHTASSSVSDPGHQHTEMYNNGGSPRAMVSNTGDGSSTAGNVPVGGSNTTNNALLTSSENTGISVSTSVSSTGSSATNANLQPYIVVYMWKRTA